MAEEIPPALTPEEWKQSSPWGVVEAITAGDDLTVDGPHRLPDSVREKYLAQSARTLFGLMAKANAALSDDDPRKITNADVVLLLEHAATLLDDDDRPRAAAAESLRALAAKLAALLPPDE